MAIPVADRPDAVWVDCPGVTTDGIANHAMRDGCWSCAPYWERFPTCPVDSSRLGYVKYAAHGRRRAFCPRCRLNYPVPEDSARAR